MTIAIGALCTEPEPSGIRPNTLVLVADTMGSYGDVDSHPGLHKLFALPDIDLYAVAANSVDKAAMLLPMVKAHIEKSSAQSRSLADIRNALQLAYFFYRRDQFISHVFPKHRLTPDLFSPSEKIPSSLDTVLQKEWEEFDIGCELIVGAFDHMGQASMFYICGVNPDVQEILFPGYAAIGSGADKAMFWLSYRKHALNMSCTLGAFHAYEAKLMAESSAHVNEHIDLLIAKRGRFWSQSTHDPQEVQIGCPVTLSELETLREQYGPKEVAVVTRLASQKSAGLQ